MVTTQVLNKPLISHWEYINASYSYKTKRESDLVGTIGNLY